MIPIGIGLWLSLALLLSWVPGCAPLRGPSSVTGTVGESLSVTCQYEERVKMNKKFWCRGSLNIGCEVIVKTGRSEAGNGRVSFRDHPNNLTFTVTVQNLTLKDAGTYMCGVYPTFYDPSLGNDKSFKVESSVIPGSSPGSSTKVPETTRSSPVHTQLSMTTDDTIPTPSPQPRSLLSSLRFCILVFLELPLFLCMLSAVLWVNRPQRCCGRHSIGPCHENQ